ALVDGLKLFDGGCELWVCGEGPSGLRVERRGFEKYRADILLAVEKRAQKAAALAEARAASQRAARLKRLALRRERTVKT
ncbi:hypothetical protein T492DRAFT_868961, partial [Pavlovales sp. CCMP2436]